MLIGTGSVSREVKVKILSVDNAKGEARFRVLEGAQAAEVITTEWDPADGPLQRQAGDIDYLSLAGN